INECLNGALICPVCPGLSSPVGCCFELLICFAVCSLAPVQQYLWIAIITDTSS
uniref:Uncharacterized protein n=1 Tax=Amphimedon queenslandica TaxID=400682 RepID=A0A1X7U4Z0_AMPQE